jgi:hypothetical protein
MFSAFICGKALFSSILDFASSSGPKDPAPGKTVFCGWAFSPEREDPGNPDSVVAKIPKIVGGYSPKCLEKAVELYRCASDPSDPSEPSDPGELLV